METPDPSILEIQRGRAFAETWQLLDEDDNAIDLTGCTLAFTVRYKAAADPLVTGVVTISDASAGKIAVALTVDQVAQLTQRVLHYQLDVVDTLGDTQTPALGSLIMQDSN